MRQKSIEFSVYGHLIKANCEAVGNGKGSHFFFFSALFCLSKRTPFHAHQDNLQLNRVEKKRESSTQATSIQMEHIFDLIVLF